MTFERSEAQMRAQAAMDLGQVEQQETCRALCEWLGLPLICPERSCRRAGCCAGRPSAATYGLQPCLMHYREEMRFLTIGPDRLAKQLEEAGHVADTPEAPTEGLTLIEAVYGGDRATLDRLRRPKGVKGPGSWQDDPERFARYMEEGDWRNPGGARLP